MLKLLFMDIQYIMYRLFSMVQNSESVKDPHKQVLNLNYSWPKRQPGEPLINIYIVEV